MSAGDAFFDTNVLLYVLSDDRRKANRTEALLEKGGIISVQVLNEFAAVALRRLSMPLADVREVLTVLKSLCRVEPLTPDTHELGLDLVERYGFSLYDAMIVAAALLSDARTLCSEDMQHGQLIDRRLRIVNPFR